MIMLHIFIATASLLLATAALARPTSTLVTINCGLIASTLLSGVALLLSGADLLHLCLSGLFYSLITVTMVTLAGYRLHTGKLAI